MDRKTKVLIAFPFVFIIILLVVAYYIPFERVLSASEVEILNFTPSDYEIMKKKVLYALKDLEGPFDFSSTDTDIKARAEGDYIHKAGDELSMVVISGNNKMAILKGRIVKEGDRVDGMKIAKIEMNRVLIGDKTFKWVYLEDTQ